jgi:flagellar biosynthesis chaperone FliJ
MFPILMAASAALGAELPVREVVLFKHGVGYFARAGELKPGESAVLEFKAGDMNDVLKSLTVADRSGGKIAGLRYDASEPLERRLSNFPFAIGERQPISAFLDHMKGARLEIKFNTQTIAGAILGARVVPASQSQPEKETLSLLLDSGEIQMFDLAAITGIRFSDAAMQAQLRDYLALIGQSRSQDKRRLRIDSVDQTARQIVANYMLPSAVWKSSYRLIFGETGDPTLEGWAIVDNTTGEDWNNVRLAVVSGRPVSFQSLLYEPRYRDRPIAELAEDRPVGPIVHQAGIGGGVVGGVPQMAAAAPAAPPPGGIAEMSAKRARGRLSSADAMKDEAASVDMIVTNSAIAAAAEGRELGDLFEYRFAQPVTIKKNESAMLPFLQQKVGARKLLIYSENYGQNPMNAAEITNVTGKTLDGGPITVYDGGAYGGEALVETVKAGDKRLISYSVDLGTRVTTAFDTRQDLVRDIHFKRGILTTKNAMAETRTFTIKNVDSKSKTLVIEHPKRPGYDLINLKPAEVTATAYRFEVKLAPNSEQKFAVNEERVYEQSTQISTQSPDYLLSFVENKKLPEAARRQLEQAAQLKQQMASVDGEIRRAEQQLRDLNDDQNRLRENIRSLNSVQGQQAQVQQYAQRLSQQESQVAAVRDQLAQKRRDRAAVEQQLNSLIDRMAF